MKIKAHIRLENGRMISAANARRIVVRGNKDISKTHLGLGFTSSYRETWVIMHEPKGYIWREITHGCGINGHFSTLRGLVLRTAAAGYDVEVLPDDVAPGVFDCVRATVERNRIPPRSAAA
jgi:hypothetical protein